MADETVSATTIINAFASTSDSPRSLRIIWATR